MAITKREASRIASLINSLSVQHDLVVSAKSGAERLRAQADVCDTEAALIEFGIPIGQHRTPSLTGPAARRRAKYLRGVAAGADDPQTVGAPHCWNCDCTNAPDYLRCVACGESWRAPAGQQAGG